MLLNIDQRNEDFLHECRRQKRLAYAEGEYLTVRGIVSRAIGSPAPGYYLDYGYARREVSRYLRDEDGHDFPPQTDDKRTRRRMIREIAGKCKAMMASDRQLDLSGALARVLAFEPASSFFLTERYGLRLYYRIAAAYHRRTGRLRTRRLL